MKLSRIYQDLILAACITFAGTAPVAGQITENEFLSLLKRAAQLSETELSAIKKGDTVTKTLEGRDKQEVASLGILRIKELPAVSINVFRESMDQKGGKEMKAGGRFSDPPVFDDLRGLELDEDTIEQLKNCTVGNCDLNMSADIIESVRKALGTQGDQYASPEQIFREMLLGYVRNYSKRGDPGLGKYENRRKPVDLTASHQNLLTDSILINTLAPELAGHLRSYPAGGLQNAESSFHWSMVDFGLKNSTTLTHSVAYRQTVKGWEQLYLVSKQIYSSRYLDSSLAVTLLLPVASAEGIDTYLVFADRSRSDALEGALGGFARKVVQKEAGVRITSVLDKTHLRLLAAVRPPELESQDTAGSSLGSWKVIALATAAIIAAAILLFRRRRTTA